MANVSSSMHLLLKKCTWTRIKNIKSITTPPYICVLNCFMLSSLPCFYAFRWSALSLHPVPFLMFFTLVIIEKNKNKEVLQCSLKGPAAGYTALWFIRSYDLPSIQYTRCDHAIEVTSPHWFIQCRAEFPTNTFITVLPFHIVKFSK